MKCSISLLAGALLAVSFSASAMALDSQEVGYNIEARGARPVVAQLGKAGQFSAVENSIRLGTTAGLPWRPSWPAAAMPDLPPALNLPSPRP